MKQKKNKIYDAIIAAFGFSFIHLSLGNSENPYLESLFLFAGIVLICYCMCNMIIHRNINS